MKSLALTFLVGCSGPQHDNSSDAAGSGELAPDGNGCASQPCDILTQCGCSPLEACDINDTGTGMACRGASGGKEGSSCATATACEPRFTCGFFGATGSCMRYCANDSECIAPRGQCLFELDGPTGDPIPGVSLCTSNCDPTTTADPLCPTGWSCDLFVLGGHNIVDCRSGGAGMQGAACSASALCAPGLTCVSLMSGTSQCARICSPPSNTGCPGSTTCSAYSPPFVVGGTQYGVCL